MVGLSQPAGSVAHSHPLIAPVIANHTDLPAAAGTFMTSRGKLQVSWQHAGGTAASVSLKATLPPNTRGTVVLPCVAAQVSEGSNTIWKDGKLQGGGADGVITAYLTPSRDGGKEMHVAVVVGSGEYSFTATCA